MYKCTFSADVVDMTYDFGKLKRLFVVPVNSIEGNSLPPDKYIKKMGCKLTDEASADAVLEITIYVNEMKCRLVDKELAEAFIKIKITTWKREYDHTVPERTATYYEGYKEVNDPFAHRSSPQPRDRRERHDSEPHRQPPLMTKRRIQHLPRFFPVQKSIK